MIEGYKDASSDKANDKEDKSDSSIEKDAVQEKTTHEEGSTKTEENHTETIVSDFVGLFV